MTDMKYLLILIFVISVLSPVYAETRFNELFESEQSDFLDIADRITTYHTEDLPLPSNEKLNELLALSQNIDTILKAHQNDPTYWFMLGLNESNIASIYSQQKNTSELEKHIARKNMAYENAIKFDSDQQTLTASMYATMKHGLPEALRITAIQRELALGGNGENESYYWHLHWSNINALQQAGRHVEAQQAINNMKQELADNKLSKSDYSKIVSRAEKQLEESINQSRIPTSQQTENKNREDSIKLDFRTIVIGAIAIAAILSIIIVAYYEFVIRRKRKQQKLSD